MPLAFDSLKDLTLAIQQVEGFAGLVAALKNGRAATIDGAWKSSAALATSALGLHAPKTLLVVLAHPRDTDAWCEDIVSFAGLRPALFPAWDTWPIGDKVIDEVAGQRLRMLRLLEIEPPRFVVTTMQALLQPVPDTAQLRQRRRLLRVGANLDLDELTRWLVDHEFQRREAVELPGEYSRRGGILDVFSPDAEAPYRLEFFGDEIESLRQFAVSTQRSLGDVKAVEITAALSAVASPDADAAADIGHIFDHLPKDTWVVLVEPDELEEQGKHFVERVANVTGLFSIPSVFQQTLRFPSIKVTALPTTSAEMTCHLRVESVERFSGEVAKIRDELDAAATADQVLIGCHNEAERKRLGDVLAAGKLAQSGQLKLALGRVHAGFRLLLAPG
ncbi:MAG TPA: transcription-repair coupling factor, partial [Gemmataceae bacterium]|nr:transcription-repair coupling factor [Gemmataceae bacterium]